tara:strand:- start:164 stop:379 length:216 start_codon:yes stop_codon:yes gene_type:complete
MDFRENRIRLQPFENGTPGAIRTRDLCLRSAKPLNSFSGVAPQSPYQGFHHCRNKAGSAGFSLFGMSHWQG